MPQDCLLCTAASGDGLLCPGCLADLPAAPRPSCPVCAAPSSGDICGSCLKRPPAFDRTLASFSYAFPMDRLIQAFKYGSQLALGRFFADAFTQRLSGQPPPDAVLPLPLHPRRLRERGFNQAAEIARIVAGRRRLRFVPDLAQRVRDTAPQADLPVDERRRNIRGAFACDRDLTGLRLAVVDDVMTSGASLDELAKVLKKRGASEVQNWVVARAVRGQR